MPYRILIADDHSPSRLAIAALLERLGFLIEVAGDGREALQRLTLGDAFDLSLLDVHMPVLSGLEVLSQLRANGVSVPSILMTGHPTRAIETAALEAGALAMLRKPIQAEILRITVERIFLGGDDSAKRPPPGPQPRA